MQPYKYKSIADCEICKDLKDEEGGCAKAIEDKTFLPEVARRLQDIPNPPSSWRGGGALVKCPLCGTYYRDVSYIEYSPDGNDETKTLTRVSLKTAIYKFIQDEFFSELNCIAMVNKENAKLVMKEINQSKLNRSSEGFKGLVKTCREVLVSGS